MANSRYRAAVSFVESFSNTSLRNNFGPHKKDPSFYLERTKYFLTLIGNPDKGLKYIHITGTAGKGSVSAMTHNILTAAGKKAGLYTSPFVTTTIEKIKVGGFYISPGDFADIVEKLKPFIKKAEKSGPYGAPSAFELCLAIALIYFKKQKCEWGVLEVGLGGRYDATNFMKKPEITAITNIDYDHTEILGKTLKLIANDKAGIIKEGAAFFTSEQRPALLSLFKKVCKQKKAAFHRIPKQSDYRKSNTLLASSIAREIGIPEEAIEKGMTTSSLPCRFEIMEHAPYIILDGAHNRAKIRTTIGNLKRLHGGYKKLIVIIAIADTNKDNAAVIEPLASAADTIIVTSLQKSERKSVHPNKLIPLINACKNKKTVLEIVMDPHEALKRSRKISNIGDCILVAGSFFLAGELRMEWYSEEWVLKNRKSRK